MTLPLTMVPVCVYTIYTDNFSGTEETIDNCGKTMHTVMMDGGFIVHTRTIQKSKIPSLP
jgi:hypothetical protein